MTARCRERNPLTIFRLKISARRAFLILAILLTALTAAASRARCQGTFLTGGDVSEVTTERNADGVTFKDRRGMAVDPLALARVRGWTACRLRLLVNPSGQGPLTQSLPYDLALARQIKGAGMRLILDIFYSDTWADPGHQATPAAWAAQDYPQLRSTVFAYTKGVITDFRNDGALPDYVQIGNEISNGMLWPVGKLSNQSQFIGLLQAGIAGVRSVSPRPQIILHCNNGAHPDLVHWFFSTIASHCQYDVVGLSYYPDNGTTLSGLRAALDSYDGQFGGRPIMLVEFAYKYAFGVTTGVGYRNDPQGQAQCAAAVIGILKKHRQGAGVLYWGATFVTGDWGAESLFDDRTFQEEPAFAAMGDSRGSPQPADGRQAPAAGEGRVLPDAMPPGGATPFVR